MTKHLLRMLTALLTAAASFFLGKATLCHGSEMITSVGAAQRKAAIVVGVAYLFAMGAAIFSESYIRGALIVSGNVPLTAQNIAENAMLFRFGIVIEILTFVSDTTLIVALYVILAPVNRHLARLAACYRLVAVSLMLVMAAQSSDALRVLSGAEYLQAFQADQLVALARLSLSAHGAMYNVGFVFLGLGSMVFALLWHRSKYVPAALAGLGVVASLLLAAGSLVIVLMPSLSAALYPWYMLPMFFFEVGMGLWLLIRNLRPPVAYA